MPEETESGANLLARKEYTRAVPLLKRDLDKYPSNPRIRLQYADALAGAGSHEDAIVQYEETAKYYDDNGLTVQAIAVRKKAEKLQQQLAATKPKADEAAGKSEPLFNRRVPKSPLFEVLGDKSARRWFGRWSSSSTTKGASSSPRGRRDHRCTSSPAAK